MKLRLLASLALSASLSLTGCSTSPTAEENIPTADERIAELTNEFESKLERYEECLKENAVLSPRAERINEYLTEPYKLQASIEQAFSFCAQYRP